MARRKAVFDAVLRQEIWTDLRAGKHISEGYINGGKRWLVYGLIEGQKITVNPALSVMDSLVHELIHRARPRWGEARVVKETCRILRAMPDEEIRRWHRQYNRVKRLRKTPIEGFDDDEQV